MIYTLGDSIIKGVYLNSSGKYQLPKKAMLDISLERLGFDSKNLGVFGATAKKGLSLIERQSKNLIPSSPVFVLFGGNDCNHHWDQIAKDPSLKHRPLISLEAFATSYQELIKRLRELGLKPITISLPPLDHRAFFNYLSSFYDGEAILSWLGSTKNIFLWQESYDKKVREISSKMGLPLLDLRRVLLETEDYQELICNDGMHLNLMGQESLAEKLIEPIKELLDKII